MVGFSSTAGTNALPGPNNTYVKNLDATGRLIVGFSRDPKKFALPRYVTYMNVKKSSGYYLRITAEEAGRIVGSNLDEFVWPDGHPRPQRNAGHEQFRLEDYLTQRFDFDWTLGYKSTEQAEWDVKSIAQKTNAQKAMTARTQAVHTMLADTNNWDSSHVSAVSSITGNTGSWELSTTQRGDIKRSLNWGRDVIRKATLSVVRKEDLVLVMNPITAARLGESQEIRDYIKGSEDAWKEVNEQSGRYSEYGMPNSLYGYEVVVEDAVKVTTRRGATVQTRADVMADGICYMLSRVGGLDGNLIDGPNFSTVTLLLYEEMTVEEQDEPLHRRVSGHVVEDYAPAMTCSISGFHFTGVIE